MNKKKTLVINYYFPPSGGPAVQRWLSFVRRLLGHGVVCDVVTIDEKKATFPLVDETLVSEIPAEVQVFRTDTSELFWLYKRFFGKVPANSLSDEPNPGALKRFARYLRGNYFLPDPRIGWNRHAYAQALSLLQTGDYDTFVTAGPPHSTHLVGLELKKRLGERVRWVADIHDYWTDISYLDKFYRRQRAQERDRAYERAVLLRADHITTHCQMSKRLFEGRTDQAIGHKISVLTMGYDEEKFAFKPQAVQREFTVTYTGTMADFYEPEAFFRAFKNVMRQHPDTPFRLQFVGVLAEKIRAYAHSIGLADTLHEAGYVSHDEAVGYVFEASALLSVNPHFRNEALHVPGKIYEYLAAEKPIFNVAPPDGETADIVNSCRAGRTFARSQEYEMAEYLHLLVEEWKERRTLDFSYEDKPHERYSRQNETAKLAKLLAALAEGVS